MTNRFANWERLESVIRWANMTTNYFALHIGLARAENLYHIKRGNYGISYDLADRIVQHFPEIDRTWLLTGIGSMIKGETPVGRELPYYDEEIEGILGDLVHHTPSVHICMPSVGGCDIISRSVSRAMCETNCAVTELFLKRVDVDEVVLGNEYVLRFTDGKVLWRKVRWASDKKSWRLVARNREDYADMVIDPKTVEQAWRVIARMAILAS